MPTHTREKATDRRRGGSGGFRISVVGDYRHKLLVLSARTAYPDAKVTSAFITSMAAVIIV
jgi:hypothetical protein